MYDSIIFDLDGTLWDVSEACARGWNNALIESHTGHVLITPDDIRRVSGLPFEECVSTLLGGVENLNQEQLGQIIDREERREITHTGGELYEGVKNGIAKLSERFPLFLISNCQDWYLESFWDIHGLKQYFKDYDCYGSSGAAKSKMIARLCRKHALRRAIYVGDTNADQIACKEAGVEFGLASYGFGSADQADHCFTGFEELLRWFGSMGMPLNQGVQGRSTPQA